jgi:phosphatidylinositol dimannoside acyltransferase
VSAAARGDAVSGSGAPAERSARHDSGAGRLRRPNPRFRHEDRDWLRRGLSIALAQSLSWTVGLMPDPARYWLADRAGDVWHRSAPTYRGNVRENLQQALGPERRDADLDALVRDVFRDNARNFTDLFQLPHWDRRDFDSKVRVNDWSLLERAFDPGNGVVLVTAHLGAFDVVGQAISAHGLPLTAVTGRTTTRFIFDAVNYLRASNDLKIVEANPGGVRTVIKALRRNEAAAFLADYDFFRNGLPVRFFGRETTLPPGPVRLARDTGAQVIGAFAQRCRDGYQVNFTTPFNVEKTRDLEADLTAGMIKLVEMLERAIGPIPEQWVILQRVGPDAPADPVRIFPEGSPLESELLKRVDEFLPPR